MEVKINREHMEDIEKCLLIAMPHIPEDEYGRDGRDRMLHIRSIPGIHGEIRFRGRGDNLRTEVGIHFQKADKEINDGIINQLRTEGHMTRFEKKFGVTATVKKEQNTRWIVFDRLPLDKKDEIVNLLESIIDFFIPRISWYYRGMRKKQLRGEEDKWT